jgi:hypothetical protein
MLRSLSKLKNETKRTANINYHKYNTISPVISIKTFKNGSDVFYVLLCLFPHIKYWTIFARTEDILVDIDVSLINRLMIKGPHT